MELGEYIYRDIEKNSYLINLYTKLLKKYTDYIFNLNDKDFDLKIIDINHLLRFADLLSKSTNSTKKQIHNNIAQNIVGILNKIYPDNDNVTAIMISVLNNINNYRGIKDEVYYNNDIREFIAQYIEKQLYKINDESEELYFVRDQKEIYNAMKNEKFYSYSGPTSMGKTFVIKTFIINKIKENVKENFVIVVPTKALISEIASDFINELNDLLNEKKYKVITTSNSIDESSNYNYIMIYTQERFLQHLLNCTIKINYVFIDEAHKMFEKDSRNVYFYKILDILNSQADMPCIFFSAPLIENPNELLKLLPNTVKTSSKVFKFSPVNQQKYIIDYNDKNIRVYNDLTKSFIELEYDKISKYDINNILQILGEGYTNLVYYENKEETVEMALEYANSRELIENNEELEKIKKRIKEEIHPDYYLAELISKGIAYHVSYVPSDIRKYIEMLYKKKTINTIFCTSTLLEGVNLPADNLFVTIKNRTSLLKNELDFKNLIGRVGRIKYYNLIGNVFIIPKSENHEIVNQCSNMIENDVPKQELLIKQVIGDRKKKEIVEQLKKGDTFIKKTRSMTYPQYESIRYIMNTLINDIVNEKMGNISQEFSSFINDEDKKIIKEVFEEKKTKISNNMPITIDQIDAIDEVILKENLVYPSTIEYKEVLGFLETLYWNFEWNIYESKKSLGNLNNLKYYAVVLQRWMLGLGLSQIIKYAIEHHEQTKEVYNQKINSNVEYIGSIEQKNWIINGTLNTIENIVLFKIANYFSEFSERYKKTKNIDFIENDWYEYVQYGTNKDVVILLQKMGFSREAALKIYNKDYYVRTGKENDILIKAEIFDDSNVGLVEEAIEVKLNNSDKFI